MINKQKLEKGIAAYSHEQEILLRLIRKTGGLTETKFDDLFRMRECKKSVSLRVVPVTKETFVLGGVSYGIWGQYLEILQVMMELGLVGTTRNDANEIVYILPKGSCND